MMTKILIIDDEPSVRKTLKKLLEKNNYQVIEAQNGDIGIKVCLECKPDLVITDLIMPKKEGIETIRELKKQKPNIPIIAISGGGVNGPEMYLNLASEFGAIRTFAKPIDNKIFISAIKEIMT
jgi:YesN/AraC family two-component response regulator